MENSRLAPDGISASGTAYAPPRGSPSLPSENPVRRATSSIAPRLESRSPRCTSTRACRTVSLPLLVTVPLSVRTSPFTGALGVTVSRDTVTVRDPVAAAAVCVAGAAATACAAGATSPTRRGRAATAAAARRSR